jgi:hypothetical protein
MSDDGTKCSWIDHIVCNSPIDVRIREVCILYDIIISDHKPVAFTIDLTVPKSVSSPSVSSKTQPTVQQWHLCNSCDLLNYQNTLDGLLQKVTIPILSDDADRAGLCDSIDSLHSDITSCLKQACISCIPTMAVSNSHFNVAGWNSHVREKHEAAREAFLTWRSNGSVKHGPNFELMRLTRGRFKLALRYCRNHIEQMEADACANALQNQDAKKFWSKVRQLANNRATTLVTSIDGISEMRK